jgi:GNAT superfamily N-acetyltransferase
VIATQAASDNPVIRLRDGRGVSVSAAQNTDATDVERLIAAADAPRAALYQRIAAAHDERVLALAAREHESGRLVGFIACSRSGELAGVVDPEYRGIGLGTLLLHQAAEHARDAGIEALEVELHPGAEETAEMLRDAGLATQWDIDFPVTRVKLMLGRERPGWATPKPQAG